VVLWVAVVVPRVTNGQGELRFISIGGELRSLLSVATLCNPMRTKLGDVAATSGFCPIDGEVGCCLEE